MTIMEETDFIEINRILDLEELQLTAPASELPVEDEAVMAVTDEILPVLGKEETENDELDLSEGDNEGRSMDALGLYLQKACRHPLLTREDEIRVSKRYERGRTLTIRFLARSPIAINELIAIRDEIRDGRTYARDVVGSADQSEAIETDAVEDEESTGQVEIALARLNEIESLFRQALSVRLELIEEPQKKTSRGKSAKVLKPKTNPKTRKTKARAKSRAQSPKRAWPDFA